MFIVLRKSSVERTLALAILLLFAGISLVAPNFVSAKESNLMYIYPMPQNNPVQPYGLFISENPQDGSHPLNVWQESFPNKRMVVGVPDQYKVSQAMLGNNLGNYVVARIKNKLKDSTKSITKNNKNEPPQPPKNEKEVIIIKRQIGTITEEVRVEIGEHLKDSDTFEKIYDSLNKGLIPNEILEKEIEKHKPAPQSPQEKSENAEATTMVFGGTLILSGMALLAKILLFAL